MIPEDEGSHQDGRQGELMVRFLFFISLLQSSWFAYAKTVKSIAIAPQGAVIVAGTSVQYSVTCTYSDDTSDNCAAAGGATWTTPTLALSVNNTGLATWNPHNDPENSTLYASGAQTAQGIVTVTAGGLRDSGTLLAESTTDTFATYPTPDHRVYRDLQTGTDYPVNVVVGATVAMGMGFTRIRSGKTTGGNPFQMACNWKSSNNSIATISRYGLATAVSPGNVTISCAQGGDGVYATGSAGGAGNTFAFHVVAPRVTAQTWYVRPDGGTPYVNRTQTPGGQCNGKYDKPYPGSGKNQNCAMGNLRYLWTDEATHNFEQWMIGPGDTVIVRQKTEGYNIGLDERGVGRGGARNLPVNCGNGDCYMPSIPSGTAAQHTRILGENYSSCHADSAKTRLNVSWASKYGINVRDSQFVDVGCFEITDAAGCGGTSFYTNACKNTSNSGGTGITESALTASVTYTDVFIHGLTGEGINGATGAGVVANYVHIRGVPMGGIDMDDGSWGQTNISVAGGFTMTNSITEFVGCVEEYPIVHNYPYIECRDSETGGYGDGFGTASTTGNWVFDHDIWRYNFQDGLDLLHSGLQSLSVTNSSSYGNDGQAYKIGSADTVIFQNNLAVENCRRIGSVIGDEPASAIVPGVNLCRADGDWVDLQFAPYGTYTFQGNTFVGYGDVALGFGLGPGANQASAAKTTLQNNLFLGYSNSAYADGQKPALFCENVHGNCNHDLSLFPANHGWAIRDHNLYYNFRSGCPSPLTKGEICADPSFIRGASLAMSSESAMETSDFHLSSSSPARGAGVAIPGLALDYAGRARANPPSIGAFEYTGDDKSAPVTPKKDTLIIVFGIRFLGWVRETAIRCRSLVYRSIRHLWSIVKICMHSFQRA
jgi:hypothetical protein